MSVDLSRHRQAYAYCAYCPKVCRFACPVSEATGQETVSTWGKMSEAYLVTEHGRVPTQEDSAALHACTGCMRCRTFCKHQNEVGFALFSARGASLSAGTSPQGAVSTLATFREHQNPFGADLAEKVARYRPETPVRHALFPGCGALVKSPEAVEDALFVGEALSIPLGVCKAAARCCGYPLYAAGDLDGFTQHAKRVAATLSSYPELVVLDPGCAYTLKVVYPRVGVPLPNPPRTIHEVLAERIPAEDSEAVRWPKLPLRAAYQDPCHLGRGLGQYEAPRKLLAAAVMEPLELSESREEAPCSGGGGLLPRTMPEVSVEVAKRAAARAGEAEVLVTACPTSRRMFQRAGTAVEDLLHLIRRWIESGEAR